MNTLNENEMRGFLRFVLTQFSSQAQISDDQLELLVLEHYFSKNIYRNLPEEVGNSYAVNLQQFLQMARAGRKEGLL